MLTERGIGLLLAGAALWGAARSFGVAELQMAALAAIALVALAAVYTLLASTRLEVRRDVRPARLAFGGQATTTLELHNVGRWATALLEVRDQVPRALSPETSPVRLTPLSTGARVEIRGQLQARARGRFALGPVQVRVHDPFGLFARRRTVGPSTEVVVHPPVWPLPDGLPLGGASASGGARRSRAAHGEELADVREYVRGDDLRTVHWATTAHRGKLMVRRSESPQEPRATVLLDVRNHRHAGRGATASFETAVAAAASATHHLAQRGRSVVLLDAPVGRAPDAAPWTRWLEHLATVTPGIVDHEALLGQLASGVAGDGALVAVATVPAPEEMKSLVRAGRAFATRPAVLVDVASHTRPGASDPATADAVAALRAAGWRVTLIGAGERLDERWQELLRSPSRLGVC